MLDFLTQPVTALTLLLLIIWCWRESRRIHELTLLTVRRICQAHGMQLLDATVRLQSLRIKLRGRVCIQREYRFEFSSDGNQRQFGWVFLEGDRPRDLRLQDADGQMVYQRLDQ